MNLRPLAALLLAAGLPSPARAQGAPYLTPSIAVAEVSDSNVFSTPTSAESDIVFRTSPAVRGGFGSSRVFLAGSYTFDAEQYRNHPALNDALARQQADLNLHYDAWRTATFTTSASYLTTHTAQELNVQTGLSVQRAPAAQYSVAPALSYQFNAVTRGSAQFEYSRSAFTEAAPAGAIADAPWIVTRTFTFGLDRRLSSTDTALAQYREQEFEFGGTPSILGGGTSRAMLAGWTHDLSASTRGTVMAGPRFSDGGVRPEISADVRRRFKAGDVAVSFARTETVALGEAGTIEVERLTAGVTVRPMRRLEFRGGPAISRDTAPASGLDATVYLVNVAATSALTRWLSVEASYQDARERGDVSPTLSLAFARRIFTVRAITTAPARRAQPPA